VCVCGSEVGGFVVQSLILGGAAVSATGVCRRRSYLSSAVVRHPAGRAGHAETQV